MAQTGVDDLTRSEYEDELDDLIVSMAKHAASEHDLSNPHAFSGVYEEVHEAIEGSFYEEYPVAILRHCEHSTKRSIRHIAHDCEDRADAATKYAHALLTEAVQNALFDLYGKEEVAGVWFEESNGGGTLTVAEA